MIEVIGKNGVAKIMCDQRDELGIAHLYRIMSAGVTEGSVIRVMPDYHEGKGSVIGFTQRLDKANPRICPNTVGVDIGCRVSSMKLPKLKGFNFESLDKWIRQTIPLGAGSYVNGGLTNKQLKQITTEEWEAFETADRLIREDGKKGLSMKVPIEGQLFSLGGGNHFISLNRDSNDDVWLSVHSGSRNFGLTVATIYQRIAEETCTDRCEPEMRFLEKGDMLDHYLLCVNACQVFSEVNHRLIMDAVGKYICDMQHVKFEPQDFITTLHNYIDIANLIVRKGSVSANEGERFLLPFNMKDGIAICIGKGNEEYNWSAPHGAGRLLSRSEAKQKLNVGHEKKAMEEAGVFTTSLDYAIDEAASAYKDKDMIIDAVAPTADIKDVMKEIYNIKGK